MTPPIYRLLTAEETLRCTDCGTDSGVAGEIAPAQRGTLPPGDEFISALSTPDWLRTARFQGHSLLDIVWRSRTALPPELIRQLSPTVLLSQPVTALSGAYLRSESVGFIDFLPAIREFFNRVDSLDLDFFNIPVNRGGGHCRFSEYSPRAELRHDCNILVQAGTTARAHGEIRPITGSDESLITRIAVDFRPDVRNRVPNLPDLGIDGFAAVDPPLMTFDRRFADRDHIVTDMSGGDYDYENPLGSGEAFATPFDSIAPAPPGGHRYWMFRFSPMVDTVIAGLQVATTEGDNPFTRRGFGSLLLWAFLPTFGLDEDALYDSIGIPYDTFPRRFGDVWQLLSPLFTRVSREASLQSAPFYNPNRDYLDLDGVRRPIPDDPVELARINREREEYSRGRPEAERLPPIEMNRGPVLDWFFSDTASDPLRLAALLEGPADAWPTITSRIRTRSSDLELPWGNLHVDEGTEIRVHYTLEPARDRTSGVVRARQHLRVTLDPLALRNVDLEIQGVHLHADFLRAARAVIEIPSLADLFANRLGPRQALNLHLEGVEVEGFSVTDRRSGAGGELTEASLGDLHLTFHSGAWHLEVGGEESGSGWESRGLAVTTPYGRVTVEEAHIPEIRLRQILTGPESRRRLTVEIPEVRSRGELSFSYYPRRSLAPLAIHVEGESVLRNLFYTLSPFGPTLHQARAEFEGQVGLAHIEYESLGAIELSTLRPESGGASEPMRGNFQFRILRPSDAEERGRTEAMISLDLPFMALGAEGEYLEIPRETSTIEHGHLIFTPGSFVLEGLLNISGARLRGLGEGPTELGNYILSAESMDIHDIHARGPARFEYSPEGWSLRREGDEAPLTLGLLVENLGIGYHPEESTLPGGAARRVAPEVIHTEVRLDHAEVEVEDLRFLELQQVDTALGRRGRLTRIESGAITASHLRGGGSIWAPLPIWGFVRGLFPFLGTTRGERPPTRPDPGPILEHLPPDIRCELDGEDFFRIGGVAFRLYPLPPTSRERRELHSLSGDVPRGDWEVELEDILVNIHEAEVPGTSPSRDQFALIRVPEFAAGRRWRDLPEEEPVCRAAREEEAGAVCGEEQVSWSLGAGDYLAHLYLNDPQRGGSFLFQRWPRPADHASLEELLRACVSP